MKRGIAALLIVAAAGGCGNADDRVVVAAGTTVVDTGFLARVFDGYPGDEQFSIVGVSSLEALSLGSAGSAQLLITHLPQAEEDFLAEHPGAEQSPIFSSEFVLAGPADATLDTSDVVEAFRLIAAEGRPFVARSDGSGTAAREREIWSLAGIDPRGQAWYIETGQGMGFTLQVADQRDAFTLAEIGSLLAAGSLSLAPVIYGAGDERLVNPYRVTLMEGASEEARGLFDWLLGIDASVVMVDANFELFGQVVYFPTSPLIQT